MQKVYEIFVRRHFYFTFFGELPYSLSIGPTISDFPYPRSVSQTSIFLIHTLKKSTFFLSTLAKTVAETGRRVKKQRLRDIDEVQKMRKECETKQPTRTNTINYKQFNALLASYTTAETMFDIEHVHNGQRRTKLLWLSEGVATESDKNIVQEEKNL